MEDFQKKVRYYVTWGYEKADYSVRFFKKGTIPGRGGNVLNTAIHPHRAGKSRGGAGSPRLLLARWISYDMKSKLSPMKYRPFLSRGCFSIFAAS